MSDFLNQRSLISGCKESTVSNPGFPGFGNGHEEWFNLSISDLQAKMREAYNNRNEFKQDISELKSKYSYEVVGTKMKSLLEKI